MNNSSYSRGSRPSSIKPSKSFTRFEPVSRNATPLRSRATTVQSGSIAEALSPEKIYFDPELDEASTDVFEQPSSENSHKASMATESNSGVLLDGLPDGFDELPIELISLTDRFIASLITAKVYSTPPSVEKLSDLFQDFYIQAESHISTHVQTLSTRQHRDSSPAPSVAPKASARSRGSSRLQSKASKDALNVLEKPAPEQQMLTTNEISERRKARKLLDHKRLALEESVERRVCEGVYDRIWRHRGTLDEIRDEKLHSRTAALALVGIGLKDLGIDFDASNKSNISNASLETEIEEWISKARESLLKMNESRNPLGKLQQLAFTHQKIVDLLTRLHQSSSSADEILPTLIYTLISSPTKEHPNVISNLHFIQRFRSSNKINGEAAYCLTNLEAAITFLETVDLASLRSEETPEKQRKSSAPSTPHSEELNPWPATTSSAVGLPSPISTPVTARPTSLFMANALRLQPDVRPSPPASPSQQRRLSTLFHPPVSALGAASDAVRTTADQGFKTIGNTLDNSFKLLFGRLKEQQVQGDGSDADGAIIVPKTLDDARRLVSPKPFVDEDGNISETSSFAEQQENGSENHNSKLDDRLLDLIGGRKQIRDRSVDSVLSTSSSNKRLPFIPEPSTAKEKGSSSMSHSTTHVASTPVPISAPNTAVESMRSLGNSLNPLNRFAGMNPMRGFGKSASITPPVTLTHVDASEEGVASKTSTPKVKPPIQRFLKIDAAEDLRIGEVNELLKDYQRLAGALKSMGLF